MQKYRENNYISFRFVLMQIHYYIINKVANSNQIYLRHIKVKLFKFKAISKSIIDFTLLSICF